MLEHLETQERKTVAIAHLYKSIERAEIQTETLLEASVGLDLTNESFVEAKRVTSAQQQTVVDKMRWLDALRQAGVEPDQNSARSRLVHRQLASGQLSDARQFTLSTLKAAKRKLDRSGGDTNVLIPAYQRRGGAGGTRTSVEAESVIQEQIDIERANPTRRTALEIHNAISIVLLSKAEASACCIAVPSLSTVARRLDRALDRYEQAVKLVGQRQARNLFRETSRRPRPDRSLLEIQIDDVDSGIFLIDDRNSLPFGRAYVTTGIDDFDKVPMGLVVGSEHRSSESAVNCILDGLLPKEASRPEYEGLADQWIGYGYAAVHLMDNPLYNHADRLTQLQLQIKSTYAWAKPYTPTEKTSIEHFNDVMKSRCFPKLPGWSDGNIANDSVKRGMKSAIMTESQFKHYLVKWIVGDYLHTPGEDGLTPMQRRERSLNGHTPILRWTYEQLRLFRMRHYQAKFRESGGIEFVRLRYRSEELARIRKQIGNERPLSIFVDAEDLRSIVVEHPFTKVLIRVPCDESPEYVASLTLRQQQLVLKKARVMKLQSPSIEECVRARNELARDVEKLRDDPRLRRRRQAVQERVEPVDPGLVNQLGGDVHSRHEATEKLMTDLEHEMMQIDEVDISDCDWSTNVR